uniref:hypothetical protein n=1 Tax=Candidatus Electronema sp. TaxID=2698783 RepID=UPI004056480C
MKTDDWPEISKEDYEAELKNLPKSETELIAVARRLIVLLTDDPRFAGLPVSAAEMQKRLDKLIAARNAETAVNVALLQAKAAAQKAMDELNDAWQRQKKADGGSSVPPILWN